MRKRYLSQILNTTSIRATRLPYAFKAKGRTYLVLTPSEADKHAMACASKRASELPAALLARHLSVPQLLKAARMLKSLGQPANDLILALLNDQQAFERDALASLGRARLIGALVHTGTYEVYLTTGQG